MTEQGYTKDGFWKLTLGVGKYFGADEDALLVTLREPTVDEMFELFKDDGKAAMPYLSKQLSKFVTGSTGEVPDGVNFNQMSNEQVAQLIRQKGACFVFVSGAYAQEVGGIMNAETKDPKATEDDPEKKSE